MFKGKNLRNDHTSFQLGAVTAEFLLVIPSFLAIAFFVMELSLMWIDRHFVHLAAYEAARIYSTNIGPDVCNEPDLKRIAQRRALIKLAMIAPRLSSTLTPLLASSPSAAPDSPQLPNAVDSLIQILDRLPLAYALSTITCEHSDADPLAVRVNITFRRAPKMPIIGQVLWALYAISKVEKFISPVKLDLDRFYYQVLLEIPEEMKQMTVALSEIFDLPPGTLGTGSLQLQEDLTSALYAVPWSLRLIPIHASVRMVGPQYRNFGKDWDEGRATLVAPFNAKFPHWKEWAEQMGKIKNDL